LNITSGAVSEERKQSLEKKMNAVEFCEFNPDVEPNTVGVRWTEYKERFSNFMIAKHGKELAQIGDAVRKASLLHFAGPSVFKMYKTKEDSNHTYEDVVKTLDEFFVPQVNPEYEKFIFANAKQSRNEPFDTFVNRLRLLANGCKFKEPEPMIKSKIIQGCYSDILRQRALSDKTMTLERLIEEGRAMEASRLQAKQMETGCDLNVNAIGPKKSQYRENKSNFKPYNGDKVIKCNFCGKQHRVGMSFCPAKGKTCNFCKKVNHFESVCRIKSKNNNNAKTVNCLNRSESPGYILAVGNANLPRLSFEINGTNMELYVDTCSSMNVINETMYNKIASKPRLREVACKVYGYQSQTPIEFIGEFRAKVRHSDKEVEADVAVVRGNERCLISYETASRLGVVKIIDSLTCKPIEHYKAKYPNVFSDKIGKLKDFKVKLDIDETVEPTRVRHPRIPFGLRKQMEEIVMKGIDNGTFERATGPTKWLLGAMLVPKRDGRLRFVLDASPANKAIKRTRYVLPTVEDIISDMNGDMNGADTFSVFDLRDGFHQIELDESCRHITTFSTPSGLYRYKRLLMGINAAPEIFHHAIEESIKGLAGVKNIMDDIFVYSKGPTQHDERVDKLLGRLNEKGLTVNEKCKIGVEKVEFFGLEFSKEGIRLTEDKVKALVEASTPSNSSEVHSLLGLSTYSSRFIYKHADIVEPLRQLIKKNAKWKWGEEEELALRVLKDSIVKFALAYFNPNWETELVVDASPIGLGAVLVQVSKSEKRVVSIASRSLSDVERRYSQIEKECLAIVWGCEKFHLYLYGRKFIIVTDNKALEYLLKRNKKVPIRIERWAIRLLEYDFEIRHIPGIGNPADYLSRHPLPEITEEKSGEQYINYLFSTNFTSSISRDELIKETDEDKILQELKKRIKGVKLSET
jgi:hypothetical protein